MNNNNLRDNIWLTSKSRMESEKRYRTYSNLSHIIITYFSLLLIITSVFSDEISNKIPYLEYINAILAMVIFSVSLVVYAFGFSTKAMIFRNSYLELQDLYHNFEKSENPAKEYNLILQKYPNHSESDFNSLILKRAILNKQPIHSGNKYYYCTLSRICMKIGSLTAFVFLCIVPPLGITIFFLWKLLT